MADEAVLVGVAGDRRRATSAGTARTLWAATPTLTPSTPSAHARSASTRSRNASTDGSQKRTWPGAGGSSRRPPPVIGRGQQRDLQAQPRAPPRASAIAIALGSGYGVPSGWWWT